MTTTQGSSAARRASGVVLMLLGVALVGYGAHFLIRNGNCSGTGYTSYGPVPRCSGAEPLYIMSVFFVGPVLALAGWLMSRTSGWLWPLVCGSLAAGLGTIKIESAATSGAKSLGLVLGVCFLALGVLSVTLRVRKRLRPEPPTLPTPSAESGAAANDDPVDRLAKLAQLRDSGALTVAEFEREKAKILSQS